MTVSNESKPNQRWWTRCESCKHEEVCTDPLKLCQMVYMLTIKCTQCGSDHLWLFMRAEDQQ
jgi:hypothetical protein